MVVGRNNGVVGLTGFSDKKMIGLLFGPKKSGRINRVVVWRGSTVAISVVHIAMVNLYDDVYDPNGALYLYLV